MAFEISVGDEDFLGYVSSLVDMVRGGGLKGRELFSWGGEGGMEDEMRMR